MAGSFFGIGTTFYGCRETDSSGTFVTTEWAILMFLPLVPLGSYRVAVSQEGLNFEFPILSYSVSYSYQQPVPLNWRQVWNTYLFAYGLIAGAVFLLAIGGPVLFFGLVLALGLGSGLLAIYRTWRGGYSNPAASREGKMGEPLGRAAAAHSQPVSDRTPHSDGDTAPKPHPGEDVNDSPTFQEEEVAGVKVVDKRRFKPDASDND